ncbi:hypothetical protein FSW04_08310 [Baekduia soli]|uniref:Zinc-ribbon domain-containing protein n=1 Tax=Baekduia soli TaxID=496014 RepID=A0A5B8U3E8_9ACTN|nr:putative zinc-binding metallopeptidase [Baekduia soli]QEC47577.1 hypothetical protein FSW04_08310 [Baekduia soli]
MRTFTCGRCTQLVFFENSRCLHCGAELRFDWPSRDVVTQPGAPACANAALAGCNWLAEDDGGGLCFSCALTRTRPGDDPVALQQLRDAEAAKRRLLFELGEIGLPIPSFRRQEGGLAFDLLSSAHEPVTTGHADGLITLDLAESDDAHREQMRTEMGEPYRTLLGHFRHEVGHFYFPLLTTAPEALARARATFGDEREDYGAALDRHYEQGPPDGWEEEHVSAYATMHAAEDWAETFAHVLHISDTLQTAAAYGLHADGPVQRPDLAADPRKPAAGLPDRLTDWLALSYALNALNRSMGQDDLYPFVLSPAVARKLGVVDELIRSAAR